MQPDSVEHPDAQEAEPTADSEMPKSDVTGRTEGGGAQGVAYCDETFTSALASRQPGKRARLLETHAKVDPETFALTLESCRTLETNTKLNAAASDLHEPDRESALQADREKEVTKLQGFDTCEQVPQAEGEGQETIFSATRSQQQKLRWIGERRTCNPCSLASMSTSHRELSALPRTV